MVSGTQKNVKTAPIRHTPPYSQKVAGPPATVHEYDTWNTHSLYVPIAMVRSTKTLLATKPRMKLAQMLTELVTARTRGGNISATTTQTSVP